MTRNDYFLDWIFESFQSLLVPCVGLSIIWHLQTDKLRGLSRELVTTPPTYYQVWWTFIILILWSEFSESESPICHLLTLLVSRVDLFQDNNKTGVIICDDFSLKRFYCRDVLLLFSIGPTFWSATKFYSFVYLKLFLF